MLAGRKRLFVDLFVWVGPVVDGRLESDQFDGPETVYIVCANAAGEHEASIRLMPTTRPHMLGEIFPHLCPGGVPTGPTIWESTRLCLPLRHGAVRRRQLRTQLLSAIVDFALARGIACMTGVLPDSFRKEVSAVVWAAETPGPAGR